MSIPDEYMRTIWPEFYSEASDRAADAVVSRVAGRTTGELVRAVRVRKRALLAGCDTTVLEAVGGDADFLIDAQEQRAARTRGGSELRQHQVAMRREAYRAFAKVAAAGGKRKDAVAAALDAIAITSRTIPDHKTVRAWWDAIEAMGCFKMQKRE
jgi:hypothetical protein